MSDFHVLIIGAGLGGLTLAQSLRRRDISFSIHERDASLWDRPQGYRLHLDADAINAAREVLTPELHAAFVATSQWTEPYTTILGTDLSVIKRLPTDDDHGADAWPRRDGPPVHANVDRATLRQLLLAGLDQHVHSGHALTGYEIGSDGVAATFADGTTARGDVLVGADGINSTVRRQRAPHARVADAGITAIYGRVPIGAAREIVPPETLTDIFTIASDGRKVFLGLGSVQFPESPVAAVAHHAPGTPMRDQQDYVVCIVGGRHEFFPPSSELRTATGSRLREVAAGMLRAWPTAAGDVVRQGDPTSFFLVEMSTSVPTQLERPGAVTLLGDAIHGMTPTLGRGANVAMRDGTLLGRALAQVAAGTNSLTEALVDYERALTEYGFAVVREAAHIGLQRMDQNPLPDAETAE